METCDIMVVEDDTAIAGLYATFLNLMPYSFEVVTSGEDAMELIKRIKFAVCILDINLGYKSMTGVDLAVEIKKINKDTKVYALTGNVFLFDGFDPAIAGFDDVFSKPLGYQDILVILDNLLGKSCT